MQNSATLSKIMSPNEVTVINARESDLESLVTILPRAFHPINPYIKQCFPDTPAVREWWSRIFSSAINNPTTCHLLIALDPATGRDIGLLSLRLFQPDERGVGFWTDPAFAGPADIDHDMAQPMIDSMIAARERMMLGREHFLIELFGTEHGWQGKGVGTKILGRACEIADEKGVDVFVQANMNARGFYERSGFVCEDTVVMPGGTYTECMMVRSAKKV